MRFCASFRVISTARIYRSLNEYCAPGHDLYVPHSPITATA